MSEFALAALAICVYYLIAGALMAAAIRRRRVLRWQNE
jgi:hypothetical protein